jgi:hypothetical protein
MCERYKKGTARRALESELDRPGRREAASVGECPIIASGKPKYRAHRQNKNVKRKSARV